MSKIIAAYGGGFKPPTAGHFEVVKTALGKHPEIDEFIIYIGSGERDGISQDESILVWDIFANYLPMKVQIEPSNGPIGDIIRLGKNNPEDEIYFVIGGREGNEGDMEDIASRTKNIEAAYPNMKVKVITTPDKGMSGTNARKAAKKSEEKLSKFLPKDLTPKEKLEVFNLIRPVIKENLNSTKIDLVDKLAALTQHMLDKGMNIEPLPKLEFIDGDKENASDFLGRTAYYDPATKTIFLYTEGRHPKDIARSFSHEMVHHTQNLEDRLGDIITTNTQEDDSLNNIEAEANLKGTMTFRNWTDSIKEEKTKDPFGLNAYAYEIARGLEEIDKSPLTKYKIFSDMDGVLTDFEGRFKNYSDDVQPSDFEKKYGKDKFWELIDSKGVAYWVGMPWMEDGKQYWDYIKDYNPELLSSPSRSETSRLGKRLWVRNNMPGVKLTLAQSFNKKNYAEPNHILIDDRLSNIEQWRAAGGIGILHTSSDETITQLKKLGL